MIEPKPQTEIDSNIDLEPVFKRNWKVVESREYYKETLNTIQEKFATVKAKSIIDNESPVNAAVVLDKSGEIIDLLMNDPDLYGEEMDKSDVQKYHPNWGVKGTWFALGDSPETVGKLLDSLTGCLENTLEILNVPDCCIDRLKDTKEANPRYKAACATENTTIDGGDKTKVQIQDVYPSINTLWSGLGIRLLNFTPCSYDCDHAQERAKVNGRIFREIAGDEMADKLFEFLYQPAEWSGYHGLSHIVNKDVLGSYDIDEYWDKRTVVWKKEHQPKRE